MSEDQKSRILVIDDDEGIRRVVSDALKSEGYSVDTASNGKEAVEKSQTNFYNLALIDIRLPDMEGTELLTSMKRTTPEMIKIILTGYPALPNAIDAVNKGAHGYLVKPIKMDELLRTVEQHLKKQSEMKQYSEEKVAQFVETRLQEIQTQEGLDSQKTTKKQ